MTIEFFELAGAEDDRRFSPFCWRIRMALRHKRLDFASVPWRMTEKDQIAASGQDKVPVIRDGGRYVSDSWDIACYLEDRYPDHPSLFGGAEGRALSRFYYDWSFSTLHRAMIRLLLTDIYAHLDPRDKDYFRTSREARFGMTLEQVTADEAGHGDNLKHVMKPLRDTLSHQPYLGGDSPLFADYTIFGSFQWARSISPKKIIAPGDPVHDWRERMLDLFDGEARKTLAYAV